MMNNTARKEKMTEGTDQYTRIPYPVHIGNERAHGGDDLVCNEKRKKRNKETQ